MNVVTRTWWLGSSCVVPSESGRGPGLVVSLGLWEAFLMRFPCSLKTFVNDAIAGAQATITATFSSMPEYTTMGPKSTEFLLVRKRSLGSVQGSTVRTTITLRGLLTCWVVCGHKLFNGGKAQKARNENAMRGNRVLECSLGFFPRGWRGRGGGAQSGWTGQSRSFQISMSNAQVRLTENRPQTCHKSSPSSTWKVEDASRTG